MSEQTADDLRREAVRRVTTLIQRELPAMRVAAQKLSAAMANAPRFPDFNRIPGSDGMSEPTADGMLHLLNANPTLLPEAPAGYTVEDMDRRRLDQVHTCLRCGQRAALAYVANTDIGPRWLDLCQKCNHWLRTTMS